MSRTTQNEPMIGIPQSLFCDPTINPTAVRAYGAVARLCHPHNHVDGVTQAHIGEAIGVGVQAINRAFRLLKASGWLTVERLKDERGLVIGSRYTLPRQPPHTP